MLVLTRKRGERLFIDNHQIVVTVLAVSGDKIRLGITAPPNVDIHREEVWLRDHEGALATVEGARR